MKIKLLVVLVVTLSYLTVAYSTATPFGAAPPLDGTDPPHAVDTAGKPIPESSTTQPDKPLILAKDSADPKWGEHKPDAPFDHAKHSTDPMHSLDGKTVTACIECHHTEQPSAPAGQPYLKTFNKLRKEVLTAKQLESSQVAVKSCRSCHYQPTTEETDEFPPESVTYPKEMKKPPSGKLTNDVAYHINCNSCHDAAKKRDATLKTPQTCGDCHVKKS